MTLYHKLYRKMTILIPTLPQVPEYVKSQIPGFMDLNLDLLSRDGEIITVALSHYQEVYLDADRVDLKAKKELNAFLLQWLTNLIDRGHRLVAVVNGDAKPLG